MRNKKFLSLFAITVFTSIAGWSQSAKITIDSTKLKDQATKMAESFINGDYPTFIKYTYPKVVAAMGGKEKMIDFLKKGTAQMQNQGYAFKSVLVGLTDQKAKAGKEIHTLVTEAITLSVPGGTLTSNSYLLGISQDGGNNWFFVDTAPFQDKSKLKQIFPEYNDELKIPEKQKPMFTKAQ